MTSQSTPDNSDEAAGSPAEAGSQRAYTRHEWGNRIQIAWLGDHHEDTQPVGYRAHDISAGGIALLSRSMVHPGHRGVALLGRGESDAIVRGIEVCHCRYDVRIGQHVVGCSWIELPPYVNTRVKMSERGMSLIVEFTTLPAREREDAPNEAPS